MSDAFPPLAYLACPYAHADPSVMKKRHFIANLVASELVSQGICVYSPLTHDIPLNELGIGGNWEFWKKHNHKMVSCCNKLILLKVEGWENSKGVAGELACARSLNIPIEEREPPDDNEFERLMVSRDIQALLNRMNQMYKERDWEKFHSPKNLAINLAVEVGELLEYFRWATEAESFQLPLPELEKVRDEIGDVFIILVHLSEKLGIDPIQAAAQKLVKIAGKYPAALARGKSLKYTAYESQNSSLIKSST
jgi:NTP pyrophosphatase (non-canonical NTP hydrolase)